MVWSIDVGWKRALNVSQKPSINAIGNRSSKDNQARAKKMKWVKR